MKTIRKEVGWSTFDEGIGKAVFWFKVRQGKMNGDKWARRMYKWRYQESRWKKNKGLFVYSRGTALLGLGLGLRYLV